MNKSIQAAKIKIGISSCLLGNRVRYDGGHKRDSFLVQTLGAFVEYVPVCPEVEAGFSIPREAFRLVGDPSAPRMVTQKSGVDVTERMLAWAWKRAKQLNEEELCGFIFKSDSPSSGMERVKVYDENGFPAKRGIGLFARVFMEYFPSMPVEEEGRLNDFHLRENFVERVFTYWRWKKVLFKGKTPTRLIEFHSRHKLLLMAHHPQMQREMGKWVAQSKKISIDSLFSGYFDMLMNAMKKKATTRNMSMYLCI